MPKKLSQLWCTKAKYQDAFIKGKLFSELDGQALSDINQRNDRSWEMKSTFQYLYSNFDTLIENKEISKSLEKFASFASEYKIKIPHPNESSSEIDMYTDQQIVSAYIASFTNEGLHEFYEGLHSAGVVISRQEAMDSIHQIRPDIDLIKVKGADDIERKLPNSNGKEGEKIHFSPNDTLEAVYEAVTKMPIVKGKNEDKEHQIPSHKYAYYMLQETEFGNLDTGIYLGNNSPILKYAIEDSKETVTSQDVFEVAQALNKAIEHDNKAKADIKRDKLGIQTNEER